MQNVMTVPVASISLIAAFLLAGTSTDIAVWYVYYIARTESGAKSVLELALTR